MTHSQETPQPEQLDPYANQLAAGDKYDICWGVTVEQHGSNLHALGSMMHKSIYNPGYFKEHSAEFEDPRFPDRIDVLSAPLPIAKDVPEEGEFRTAVSRAVTRDVDFESCLYPGALGQLEKLMDKGPVVMWTAGDTLGTEGYPGSLVQLHKMAAAGLNKVRMAAAKDSGRSPKDVLTTLSSENKLSDKIMERVNKLTENHRVIAIEDRLQNLVELQKHVPSITPVWVQQDKYGNKIPASLQHASRSEIATGYNAIPGVTDLSDKVDEIIYPNDKPPLFLLDYDGVFTNDTLRGALQKEAVIASLSEHGWI